MTIKIQTKQRITNKDSKFNLALVDGDLITFAVASSCDGHYWGVECAYDGQLLHSFRYKKELDEFLKERPLGNHEVIVEGWFPEKIDTTLHSLKVMTESILNGIGAKDYQIYLSGPNNFRFKVNPAYKANRVGVRRPFHLDNCRNYLVKQYGAIITDGYEADDAVSIDQDKINGTTVIASIDKDLLSTPGWHYHWPHHGKEAELHYVTEDEANRTLYKQILTGDRTDGIIGIHGMGAITAEKALKLVPNERLYSECLLVYQRYKNPVRVGFKSQMEWARKQVAFVANQIYILRKEGEFWNEG